MVSQCWQTDVWTETHHVRAHVPVSRECTMDTERFFHFHERKSFCLTALGFGSCWSKWWTTLKIRENASTDSPGWLLSAGNSASILTSPLALPFWPRVRVLSSLLPLLQRSPGVDWQMCAQCDGAVVQDHQLQGGRGWSSALTDDESLIPHNITRALEGKNWRVFPSQPIPVCWCLSAQQRAVAPLSARLPEEWGWEWWTGSGVGGAAAAALFNSKKQGGAKQNESMGISKAEKLSALSTQFK